MSYGRQRAATRTALGASHMHRCVVGALALGSFLFTFIMPAASDKARSV